MNRRRRKENEFFNAESTMSHIRVKEAGDENEAEKTCLQYPSFPPHDSNTPFSSLAITSLFLPTALTVAATVQVDSCWHSHSCGLGFCSRNTSSKILASMHGDKSYCNKQLQNKRHMIGSHKTVIHTKNNTFLCVVLLTLKI